MCIAHDLIEMTKHNRDGAFMTQGDRKNMLLLMTEELKDLGFKLHSPRSIKKKHFDALIESWHAKGINPRTMNNRMAVGRWWVEKVGKRGMMPKTNKEMGILTVRDLKEDKAQKLDMEKVDALPSVRMKFSMRMMAAFGLRRKEAIHFDPRLADKGDFIALKPSWTKGGRARNIPITMQRQRDLLNEIKETIKNGSLIPEHKSYIQHYNALGYNTTKQGMTRHGLRHNYAQFRYKELTDWACPKKGGMTPDKMTPEQLAKDQAARLEISQELGHERVSITRWYLG